MRRSVAAREHPQQAFEGIRHDVLSGGVIHDGSSNDQGRRVMTLSQFREGVHVATAGARQ